MNLILDFDCTIFNTDAFREKVIEVFARHGVDCATFHRTLEASKAGERDWKPEIQFNILEKEGVGNLERIRDGFTATLENAHSFLYEDTVPFLEKMKKLHQLAILSYGEDRFQNTKIKHAAIESYFEKIIVTNNIYKDKEASDLSADEPAVFVEDNPSALSAAKRYTPHITTVRINRGDGRYAQEASGEGVDHEVKTLKEVEEIVSKLPIF